MEKGNLEEFYEKKMYLLSFPSSLPSIFLATYLLLKLSATPAHTICHRLHLWAFRTSYTLDFYGPIPQHQQLDVWGNLSSLFLNKQTKENEFSFVLLRFINNLQFQNEPRSLKLQTRIDLKLCGFI